jgi:hypothetical protein
MQFYSLEEALEQPAAVRQLILSRQNWKRIPAEIWQQLPHLESLDLRHNQIKQIPAGLEQLQQLQQLRLADNRITQVQADLAQLPKLKHLDLSQNRLRKLPLFPDSLEILDLSDNKLKAFPISSYPATSLLHLNLANNKIGLIDTLAVAYPNLQFINLSACKLRYLPALPTKLYALNISKNQVTALPPNWQQIDRLQRLDLARTPLNLRLSDLNNCSALAYLDVRQNPTQWTGVEALLRKLPQLSHAYGGFTAKTQQLLSRFLSAIPPVENAAKRAAYWQLWQGFAAANVADKVLWSCLHPGLDPMIQIGAYYELCRRHTAKYGYLLGRKWWIAGTTASLRSELVKRLNKQKVTVVNTPAQATGIILGHLFDDQLSTQADTQLPRLASLPIIDEAKLMPWLDRREGRYFTGTRDRNALANIERMLLASDQATFQLGILYMRQHGTPASLLPILMKKWQKSSITQREQWADIFLPYLPGSINIALAQDRPLPQQPSRRGAEGALWKLMR